MKNKSLTIQTDANNVEIDYPSEDVVRVKIHNNMSLHIEMDNDVLLESHGDFAIAAEGELSLISLGQPVCIDSVDSVIHMNYRESKLLKHLPESIEYRKKLEEENKKCIEFATMAEMMTKTLKERVSELEKEFKILEKRVTYIAKTKDDNYYIGD